MSGHAEIGLTHQIVLVGDQYAITFRDVSGGDRGSVMEIIDHRGEVLGSGRLLRGRVMIPIVRAGIVHHLRFPGRRVGPLQYDLFEERAA